MFSENIVEYSQNGNSTEIIDKIKFSDFINLLNKNISNEKYIFHNLTEDKDMFSKIIEIIKPIKQY